MLERNLSLKKIFDSALQHHQKNNLEIAKKLYKEVLKEDPNHAISHNNLGMVLKELGQFQNAINCYQKAIQINPNLVDAHHNLGNVQKKLRKFKEAGSCYEKAIKIQPLHIPSHNNLGMVFQELGDLQKSKSCYEKAIQINPNYADVHNNLGRVFQKLEESEKAISCYKKAIQINPNHANAYYNLGLASQGLGDSQKEISYYKRAIKIQPSHVNAHNNLGIAFQELGEFKKAISCYQKTLKYEPENLTYLYQLSDLKKDILDSKLKNKINKIMRRKNCEERNLAYGNFLLAKYALKTKNYEKEFNYLLKGHRCYFDSESKKFNKGIDYCLNELPKIKKLVNTNQSNRNIEKIHYKIKPIFIIGIPRCGSTLVEKVIASGTNHIPIGEETGIFGTLVKQKILKKHDPSSDIENLRTKLIERYKQKGLIKAGRNYTFTDKSLDNFFYLGLIKESFVNAKVVDCRRNVLSSIISILRNNLTKLAWTHNLEHIFKYFDIYYKTIESYKKIFPNFVYELQFEKLINNPEEESKKLMKFCELPWDKKCLEFYKRKDLFSKTASNIQIRKPIYKHPEEKYLPYKKFLNNYRDKYHWFNSIYI